MENKIQKLWNDLRVVELTTCNDKNQKNDNAEIDKNEYRLDDLGAIIKKSEYGLQNEFGWTIDHILPISKGGTDNILNLQLLHWKNNQSKGDDFPTFVWATAKNFESKTLQNRIVDMPKPTVHSKVIEQLSTIYPFIQQYVSQNQVLL